MAEVIIVDDEKLVLYGIKSLLTGGRSVFEVHGLYQNGEDALNYLREHTPDFLLTDIKMPGMDGLYLIEEVRKFNKRITIIVLSCFDDFHLVRKAFVLGADEYLLKHDINRDLLLSTLGKFVPSSRWKSKNSSTVHGREITPLLLYRKEVPQAARERITSYIHRNCLRILWGPLHVCVLGFKKEYDSSFREIPWSPDRSILVEMIQGVLDDDQFGECFIGRNNEVVCIFPAVPGSATPKSGQERIHGILERIISGLSKYLNRKICIGVAETVDSILEISQGLSDAGKLVQQMFFFQESRIIYPASLESPERESSCGNTPELQFLLSQAHPIKEWIIRTERYFRDAARGVNMCSSEVKLGVTFALQQLNLLLKDLTGEDLIRMSRNTGTMYEKIHAFDDAGVLKNWLILFLQEVWSNVEKAYRASSIVGSIEKYLSENFREDITLQTIAGRFNISVNYLSQLFKRESGLSLIDYLNHLRIDRACGLLNTTTLSGKEIAFKVGYNNPNYFIRVFKQITGRTVREYRSETKNCEDKS